MLLQETFHVILHIDDIKVFIHCPTKHVEDISNMKKKQGTRAVSNHGRVVFFPKTYLQKRYFSIADRYFMQYMGAFYANSVAGGLIENKMCSVDSSEVLLNVARLRDAEEAERHNRAVAVNGLLTMNSMQKGSKKREYEKKFGTLFLSPVIEKC